MANVTAANVTINRAWTEGGTAGKDVQCREVTINVTAAGTVTDTARIPATAMGLTKIEQAVSFRRDNDKGLMMGPSYDGAYLVYWPVTEATDADRENMAVLTDIIRGVVKGY